jgi:hypothetical protein
MDSYDNLKSFCEIVNRNVFSRSVENCTCHCFV